MSRGGRAAAEAQQQHQHPKLAASTSHESKKNSIEPDPSPKKRQLIQSASSAATCTKKSSITRLEYLGENDGRWTVTDRPEIRGDPFQVLHCHFEGARIWRERITKQTCTNSEPLLDVPVATQSKTTNGLKPIQIVAECELKNVFAHINETSTEEVQRGEQRKKGVTVLQQQYLNQNQQHLETHWNWALVKTQRCPVHRQSRVAVTTQERVKRSATEAEPEAQIGVPMEMFTGESATLPSALTANTRRIIFQKPVLVAVTTQVSYLE